MAADGSIVINANLDDKQAQAELNRLEKRIYRLQDKLNRAQAERSPLAKQAEELSLRYEEAARRLEMMQSAAGKYDAEAISQQNDLVKSLYSRWNEVQRKVEQYDKTIAQTNTDIEWDSEKAGALARRLATVDDEAREAGESMEEFGDEGEDAGNRISEAMQKATKKVDKIGRRITGMIRRVFFISVLTRALRGVREYFSNILNMSPEFATALGQLKSAFLTLAQPIVERLIPALTNLLQIITQIVTALAALVSKLFGTTFAASQEAAKGLYEQAEAYKKTGDAAKKASKQLAAFDQLNVLNDNSSGGAGADSSPLFDLEANEDEQGNKLNKLLKIIEAIGAALLAWKIGTGLGMDLKGILGTALLLFSTFEFIGDYLRTWDQGITWDNLMQLLLDITGMALGAWLAFGKIGAGIALVLGGLALLAVAFHDMNENGMTLENTLTAIAGLFLAGLGLSVLTGSFIPLALAALGSLLLALVYLFGEGEEFTAGMQKIFDGLGQFFKSIFAGDVEGAIAGLELAFEGFKQVAGAVARAVQSAWQALCDWLGQKLGPEWKAFFERIGGYFGAWIKNLKLGLNGIITFIKGVFTGDLELAMQGVRDVAIAIGNSLLEFMAIVTNGIVDAINLVIGGLNSIIGDAPAWLDLAGLVIPGLPNIVSGLSKMTPISHWTPPRLAQGAVIPPNREFLAVLGDQKSGTNIEAPLDTIVAAFREVMGDRNGEPKIELRVYLDSREIKTRQQVLQRTMGV